MSATPTPSPRETWEAHYASPDGFRYYPNEELVRTVSGRRGPRDRAVEIGCGNGANLWFLAEQYRHVLGVDFVPGIIEHAQALMMHRRVSARVQVVEGDACMVPLATGQADLVVDCMTSQHFAWAEHLRCYRECWRLLRPGGLLFVFHLNAWSVDDKGRRFTTHVGPFDCDSLSIFPNAGPVCLPTPSALAEVVTEANFTVTSTRGLGRIYADGSTAAYTIIEAEAK